jgi:hypothetical protein
MPAYLSSPPLAIASALPHFPHPQRHYTQSASPLVLLPPALIHPQHLGYPFVSNAGAPCSLRPLACSSRQLGDTLIRKTRSRWK